MKSQKMAFEALAVLSQLGFTMAATVVICALLGHWIDSKLGTGVIFLVVLTIFGFVAGIFGAYRQYMDLIKKKK